MIHYEWGSLPVAADLDAVVSYLQESAEMAANQAHWAAAASMLEEAALIIYRRNPLTASADRLMFSAGVYRDKAIESEG